MAPPCYPSPSVPSVLSHTSLLENWSALISTVVVKFQTVFRQNPFHSSLPLLICCLVSVAVHLNNMWPPCWLSAVRWGSPLALFVHHHSGLFITKYEHALLVAWAIPSREVVFLRPHFPANLIHTNGLWSASTWNQQIEKCSSTFPIFTKLWEIFYSSLSIFLQLVLSLYVDIQQFHTIAYYNAHIAGIYEVKSISGSIHFKVICSPLFWPR